MFLSPRKSVVDIVQSVGRVMRKADDKEYGYIILPIGIPYGVTPESALRDNRRYAAVWEVLQALRAHDERFNAMVNRIDLTKGRDHKINVIGVGPVVDATDQGQANDGTRKGVQQTLALTFANLDEWRDAIYAKVVAKVGSRKYWEEWAKDVADIAQRHITRITALLDGGDAAVSVEYDRFLDGLRANLNEGITHADAIDMCPAPHYPPGLRRTFQRLRLRLVQPSRSDDGADARSPRQVFSRRRKQEAAEVLRVRADARTGRQHRRRPAEAHHPAL